MGDVNILRPLIDSFLTALGYDLTNLITAGTSLPLQHFLFRYHCRYFTFTPTLSLSLSLQVLHFHSNTFSFVITAGTSLPLQHFLFRYHSRYFTFTPSLSLSLSLRVLHFHSNTFSFVSSFLSLNCLLNLSFKLMLLLCNSTA